VPVINAKRILDLSDSILTDGDMVFIKIISTNVRTIHLNNYQFDALLKCTSFLKKMKMLIRLPNYCSIIYNKQFIAIYNIKDLRRK
jgi:hypothetical protein